MRLVWVPHWCRDLVHDQEIAVSNQQPNLKQTLSATLNKPIPYSTMIDTISEALHAKAINAINDTPGILLASTNDPYSVLVYTEDTDIVERVGIHELPLKYPCSGRNARWNFESFGRLAAEKALLYRRNGGAICLAIPRGPIPYRIFTVCEQISQKL
jgi:hypothetical protein